MATESAPKRPLKCPNCGANIEPDCVRCAHCDAVLSLSSCPSCFGPIFVGMKHCPGCGAAVDRTAIKVEDLLACPRCAVPLAAAEIGEARIRECTQCGGIWLSSQIFESICADRETYTKVLAYPTAASINEEPSVSGSTNYYIPCPECRQLMNRRNFAGCSGILLDICKTHGVWLDRLELQKVIRFIQDGGLQKARSLELDRLKEEQNRLREAQRQHNQSLLMSDLNEQKDPDDSGEVISAVIGVVGELLKRFRT